MDNLETELFPFGHEDMDAGQKFLEQFGNKSDAVSEV